MKRLMEANAFWRHLVVAAGYALSFTLFREISFSHWLVSSGLRFVVLLLMPYRYWPALVIGETIPSLYLAVTCAGSFGSDWAIFKLVPTIIWVIPIMYVCRTRFSIVQRRQRTISTTSLVLCALGSSIGPALYNTLCLSMVRNAVATPLHVAAVHYLLGHYLGTLTVAPLALAIYETMAGRSLSRAYTLWRASRLPLDSCMILVPFIGVLLWIGRITALDSDFRPLAQMAMFLPVVGLAVRHGWQGAAIGGTVASIAIVFLMPAHRDLVTMQAQTFMVFSMTVVLLLGKSITVTNRREREQQLRVYGALSLAQRNYYAGERQFHRVAIALQEMQRSTYRLLERLMIASPHEAARHDSETRPLVWRIERLTDQLYPQGLVQGLAAALQNGQVATLLKDFGVQFNVKFSALTDGWPLDAHEVAYRLSCDCITQLCTDRPVDAITLYARSRVYRGQLWVKIGVEGREDPSCLPEKFWTRRVLWEELLSNLHGFSRSKGFQDIRDSAATFRGRARRRMTERTGRIDVLFEAAEPQWVESGAIV